MACGSLTFRRRNVVAVIKAVELAGHRVKRVEIGKDGGIAVVIANEDAEIDTEAARVNEWDTVDDPVPPSVR